MSGTEGAPVEEPAENATEAELAEYEETQAAWEALTLDNLPDYALDIGAARKLLEDDGWTLNREGKLFDAAKDDVRCKEIDGELVALELTMLYPEGNAIEKSLDATLVANLAQVGVKLNVKPMPVTELMDVYYRNSERDCDMIYLATNFATVFDPSQTFSPADAEIGAANPARRSLMRSCTTSPWTCAARSRAMCSPIARSGWRSRSALRRFCP